MSRKFIVSSLPGIMLVTAFAVAHLIYSGLGSPAGAATVGVGQAPCSFVLSGQILAGDHEKLAMFKGDAKFWSETRFGSEPVLCLDSQGGSLTEGARIARYVYDQGIQTRVGDGSICHSVCAIIFMMGNKHWGPTTVEENRILHAGGDLAFHSPSIAIDNTKGYDGEELERAYMLGVESILNIVNLANSQRPFEAGAMIHPGLIKALLETPASDLFHLTTIEQALSWDIGLEGVTGRLPQSPLQYQMACENGLTRGFRRPSEIFGLSDNPNTFMTTDVFKLAPLSGPAEYRLLGSGPSNLKDGIVYGYRYWTLPVECSVKLDGDSVKVCGYDSGFSHTIGDCAADRFIDLPSYARYHPLTEFKALKRTGIAADVLRYAQCTLRSAGGQILRDEPCTQALDVFQKSARKFAKHTLHWPDGDRTEIEIAAKPYFDKENAPDIYRVNGRQAVPRGDTGTCLEVSGQDIVICVTDR
jgi:hypothetical protein